jgi:methyl-accepting chemotaxis protein/methyl-accepting chemotaxis protein-1 (serine sensor receptor)
MMTVQRITQWPIGRKLFAGFGSMVLTAVAMGLTGLWAASTLNGGIDQLASVSGRALQLAGDVRFLVADLKARERLVVIAAAKQDKTVMAAETTQVGAGRQRLRAAVEEIDRSTQLPAVHKDAGEIAAAVQSWEAQWTKTVAFATQFAALDAADSSDAGRPFADKAEQLATDIQAIETAQFSTDRAHAASVYAAMRLWLGVLLAAATLIAFAVLYIVRQISSTLRTSAAQLRDGSEEVLASAEQVARSALTLSQGVAQEAASIEETSASMEEISSMTRRNAEHSHDVANLMAEAEADVESANGKLAEMVTSMSNIKESSRKVSNIIKTIDEIAFQTNILALNAAVEAARAGVAGLGFAVVADEVRSLAQRSAQAAKDTADLIEESIARSDRGAVRLESVGTSIQAITDRVTRAKRLIDDVSEASKQQATGFEQVSTALTHMERMTQDNASTAEASTAAGEALNAEARRSLVTVEQLEALIGQTATRDARETPAAAAPPVPADVKPVARPAGRPTVIAAQRRFAAR